MAHWQHVVFRDESRFPVDGRLRVRRLPVERFQQRCQAYRVQAGVGSIHVWGTGNFSQWCQMASCALRQICHQWALLGHFAKYLSAISQATFRRRVPLPRGERHTLPCSGSPWFPSAGQSHQDGAAFKIARLQTHRMYLGLIWPCYHRYGQPAPESWWAQPSPAGWILQQSL